MLELSYKWGDKIKSGGGAKYRNFREKHIVWSNFGEISAKVGGSCPPPAPLFPTPLLSNRKTLHCYEVTTGKIEKTIFDTFEYGDWHLTYSQNWSFAVVSFIRAKVTLRVLPFITYVGLFEQIISIFPPPSPYLIWLRFHTDSKILEDILCYLQLGPMKTAPLLNMYHWNEGLLSRQNLT